LYRDQGPTVLVKSKRGLAGDSWTAVASLSAPGSSSTPPHHHVEKAGGFIWAISKASVFLLSEDFGAAKIATDSNPASIRAQASASVLATLARYFIDVLLLVCEGFELFMAQVTLRQQTKRVRKIINRAETRLRETCPFLLNGNGWKKRRLSW